MTDSLARALPSVDVLLRHPALDSNTHSLPRALLVDTVRSVLDEARRAVLERRLAAPDADELALRTRTRLDLRLQSPLRRVLNATGVVVHTNLGRAPLSPAALEAVSLAARGYLNLEYELESGSRGSRHELVSGLLRQVTGAPDALVVNNNASALLLALGALASDREVIIS